MKLLELKFQNISTYIHISKKDFNNKEMRMNAFYILNELHNSDLVLEENFSPLKVFHNIADASHSVEKRSY